MEKNKMTVEEFLSSLVKVIYRIKYNEQWYELRVTESIIDKPFVDRDGRLFDVKNAKINFYVFNINSDITADWAPSFLKTLYIESKFDELSEDTVDISWGVSYSQAFIQYLLNYKDFLIINRNGEEVKKWSPYTIF